MNHLEMARQHRTDENESIVYCAEALIEKLGHIEQNLFNNTLYLKAIAEQQERANYLKAMELHTKDVIGFVVFDKFDLEFHKEDK